ncbi:MAG: hypothetical protein HY914_17865 [Desulfomonile tiedjei]|nr:hypothetical protein [Desulfomonile tiedjei]
MPGNKDSPGEYGTLGRSDRSRSALLAEPVRVSRCRDLAPNGSVRRDTATEARCVQVERDMSSTTPRWLRRLLTVLIAVMVGCAILGSAEFVFRRLLFSGASFMTPLKQPSLYANEFSEDYFKLAYSFIGAYVQPNDRMLGWVNHRTISPGTYQHRDAGKLGSRTPVLLYGDSFAQCAVPSEQCFEGILNRDPSFSAHHYLLNYGVNGYGVDQIYLLYRATIGGYAAPVVIVSLLAEDLDRSTVRASYQTKPYFTVDGGRLAYHNAHMDPDIHRYFSRHPPEITSYLYRLAVHSPIVPEAIGSYLRGTETMISRTLEVNRAILLEMASDLKRRQVKYVFLVFETAPQLFKPLDWRVQFLKDLFTRNSIDHILVRDIFAVHESNDSYDYRKYAVAETDHHPNELYNFLVCRKVLDWIKVDAPQQEDGNERPR